VSSEPVDEAQPPPEVSPIVQVQNDLRAFTPRVFMTWVFLAANVAVYLVMIARGVDPLKPDSEALFAWGADFAPRTLNGEPWRLVTAMFLHFGALHLGMNMLVLGGVGPFVERLFGNVSFSVLYVAAGLAGSLTSIAWSPDVVSAGASGAIFGLYGGLMGFALRNKRTIPRAAFLQLVQRAGTFLVINIVYAFSQKHIDMAGHVGGLFGGFLVGLALARPLTPEGAARRNVSAALVAGGTAALVAVATVVIPKPVDVRAAQRHAKQVTEDALHVLEPALATEDPATIAATMEEKALPMIDAEIASLEKLRANAEGAPKDALDELLRKLKELRDDWAEFVDLPH
jgi:membrane associated rhomboid family serine protease